MPANKPPNKPTRKTSPKSAIPEGAKLNTRGGPAGANQGGAPRGSSRLDPSHSHQASKQDKAGHAKGGAKRNVKKK